MSSQRKIDSAQANGAKSHGPVTEEGRKRSSMNALKHGLTARTVVLPNEDQDEYDALLDAYIRDLHPVGAVELDLVVEMANAKWRQRRLCLIESNLFEDQIDKQKDDLDQAYDYYGQATEYSHAFKTLTESGPLLALNRMESRLERAYSRALKNLLQLQRLRHPAVIPSTEKTFKNEPNPTNTHRTSPFPNPRNEKRETRNDHPETRNEHVLTSVLDTPPGAKTE